MVLSSNWLSLQNSHKKDGKEIFKKKKKKKSHPVIKASTPQRKNIMNMVDSMTKEINILRTAKEQSNKSKVVEGKFPGDSHSHTKIGDKKSQSRSQEIGKYVAIDCEFVGVGPEGKDSALARVSAVNFFGHTILDLFVRPQERVVDWRTWVSGITPAHMKQAVDFAEAQKQVSSLLESRILVGHSVTHDLDSLFLSHPKSMIRDTSRHIPFRKKYANGKTPSLKKLAKEILDLDIQGSQHSSIEDARATMLIYKSDRREFERLHQAKFGAKKMV
ncbi:LAFE_0C08768g1_1 [Lachancea fermentati]|uniref:RNA exonuclease 4 n=1 Tax=Lachancea fermentati TaxID=4955 RepID=A0A1G4MA58_LACFM|nr:LAFE_0C08768g1_1 [Lachancea fermentati]